MSKSIIINLLLIIMMVSLLGCKNNDDENPINTGFDPHTMGDYYVSNKGNDNNPGTVDEPFATWQKGFETAEPGDTVYFREGVWYPTTTRTSTSSVVYLNPYEIPNVGHDGIPENPICMFAYPGETPVLDCKYVAVPTNFLGGIGIDRCNYWHFRGLTIRNVRQSQEATVHGFITGGCSNLTFENITLSHIGGKGFVVYDAFQNDIYPEQASLPGDTIRYINCDASYCMDSIGREVGRTDFGNYSDGFWLNVQNPVSLLIIEGCRSWMNSDDGFDLPAACIVVMNNSWSFNNGHLEFGGGQGIRNDPANNPVDEGWIITNCISSFNLDNGFHIGYNGHLDREIFLYNNFVYHNNYGIIIESSAGDVQDKVYHNNIFYDNSTFDLLCAKIPTDYSNNFWGTKIDVLGQDMTIPDHSPAVTVTDADFVSSGLDSTQLRKSRESGLLPKITFGRLATGSDLIGRGVDVGMSDIPDIGIDWAFIDSQQKLYP